MQVTSLDRGLSPKVVLGSYSCGCHQGISPSICSVLEGRAGPRVGRMAATDR
jgi:hypothetical protein